MPASADQQCMPNTFGRFLDDYERHFVLAPSNLAASTRAKYLCHIKNHIRPAFGERAFLEITVRGIEQFLNEKGAAGLSWATRTDLRNLLGAIFSTAQRWDVWDGRNPAQRAHVGRRKQVREKRKLTTQDMRLLLESLPADVRIIATLALSCTLRISEVMGLQWKHIDFARGIAMVRQRYYRGDLDETKSERSTRDVPLGHLTAELAKLYPGPKASDEFVFAVKTRRGVSRSECSIRRYFVTKAAKKLGIYFPGLGWHTFRREAITALAANADAVQAMRMAGHTHMDLTLLYGLDDLPRQEAAVRLFQESLDPTLTR